MERDDVKQSERVRVVPIFASDVAVALRTSMPICQQIDSDSGRTVLRDIR